MTINTPNFQWGGVPAREVNQFHDSSDVDSSVRAQHHTLGNGPTQAAPGDHKHELVDITNLTNQGYVNKPVLAGWAGEIYYAKFGPMVTVHIVVSRAAGWGINTPICAAGTIPVGYRPLTTALIYGGNFPIDNEPQSWWIDQASGQVIAGDGGVAGAGIAGIITYYAGA